MYIINSYQLIDLTNKTYLINENKGAKISHSILANILRELKEQNKLNITEEQLISLASRHQVQLDVLKKTLIVQLNIMKPMLDRKFPKIYINSDVQVVSQLLSNTLKNEYDIDIVEESDMDFSGPSLVIFFRKNYLSDDFKAIYNSLSEEMYVVTAGVMHNLLLIDNLYYMNSGLPTHFSNSKQLLAYLYSEIPGTKNNWLLFYREVIRENPGVFPESHLDECQQGYIAYCLYQFVSQFTNLWRSPTTLDQVNRFWHIDLTNFNVHSEVAIHSPFSEYDMKLNLKNVHQEEYQLS